MEQGALRISLKLKFHTHYFYASFLLIFRKQQRQQQPFFVVVVVSFRNVYVLKIYVILKLYISFETIFFLHVQILN